jgi:hypothetical protein
MKPLQMLDVVMLWIAWAYSVFIFLAVFVRLYTVSVSPLAIVPILVSVLFMICLWQRQQRNARYLLGLVVIIQILAVPWYILSTLKLYHDLGLPAAKHFAHVAPYIVFTLLGLIALLWTAIRSPGKEVPESPPSTPPSPLSLSSPLKATNPIQPFISRLLIS